MADKAKDVLNSANGNAPGGRGLGEIGSGIGNGNGVGNGLGALAKPDDNKGMKPKTKGDAEELDEGFGIEHHDVKGSLKVHIKLDLEADIRIIARIKGDIAIGLL